MSKAVQFQDPGEGIHDGEVIEILVSEGDELRQGQLVLIVETDKASFEVESPFAGRVEKILVEVGDTIEVGQKLVALAANGASSAAAEPAPAETSEEKEDAPQAQEEEAPPAEEEDAPQAEGEESRQAEAEEAPQAEEEEAPQGEEPQADEEPERSSRRAISREDVSEAFQEENGDETSARKQASTSSGPVLASPATRRIARELGVSLHDVEPSGDGGRVLAGDVRARASRARRSSETRPTPSATEPLPDFSRFGSVERVPLRSVRRTIARRMTRAWREIPHVTHGDEADITELEAFRSRRSEALGPDESLTITAVVVKAVAAVLTELPRFNASLDPDAEELVYKHYRHIGVAVDTDRGLLVPVVRDVDQKSLHELALELDRLAQRAREGELRREEMSGGSFTVTNVGGIGGTHLTPIINPPQVAILGLARARLEPRIPASEHVVMDRPAVVQPRWILPLSLSFDHRVNDGADAARFVRRLAELLEDPERLAMEV